MTPEFDCMSSHRYMGHFMLLWFGMCINVVIFAVSSSALCLMTFMFPLDKMLVLDFAFARYGGAE